MRIKQTLHALMSTTTRSDCGRRTCLQGNVASIENRLEDSKAMLQPQIIDRRALLQPLISDKKIDSVSNTIEEDISH
jgi:hypothetical protein